VVTGSARSIHLVIKYIGSKRTLVPRIVELVSALPAVTTVCDLFTGTTRVAQGLKRSGHQVVANDMASYAEVFARCYIETDAREVDLSRVRQQLDHLMALPDVDGYVTEMFGRQSRFLQPHNGRRIDAMRPEIDRIAADPLEHAILLTSLIEAADRVDSTTGVQMAYLKQWAARSNKPLELRVPELIPGAGSRASRADANAIAPTLGPLDLVYLDPPYNQHSYHANYHVWETIARGDAPEAYGIARKRVDCQSTKSDYNSKRRAWDAFSDLIHTLDARYLIVSFNDEGYLPPADIRDLLAARGDVGSIPIDFKRYVGAQIGIHSPAGVKVGTVGKRRNTEHLFLVGDGATAIVDEHIARTVPA